MVGLGNSFLTKFGDVLGVSEATFTTIVLSIIGLFGTFATVGYKYKTNKTKPEDNSKIIFDQVNEFIKQQKEDRDALRKELGEVKVELAEVRKENQLLRDENRDLRDELSDLKEKYGLTTSKEDNKE